MVGPSRFLDHLAFGDLRQQPANDPVRRESRQGEEEGGGPPGEARDHPQRTRGEKGAHGLPHPPAHQLADLPRVVVDTVEHLAHGLLGQLGERLGHRGVEQVGAERALGASSSRIVFHHILPNVLSPLLVQIMVTMAFAILLESTLSFLGLGTQPPDPSWGSMLSTSRQFLRTAWWYGVFPGLALSVLLVGFNFLSEAVRDALDPRQINLGR